MGGLIPSNPGLGRPAGFDRVRVPSTSGRFYVAISSHLPPVFLPQLDALSQLLARGISASAQCRDGLSKNRHSRPSV